MGMPITVEIVGKANPEHYIQIFKYFNQLDDKFSTYKKSSEISQINNGLTKEKWSDEVKLIFNLSRLTENQTEGYFNIYKNGYVDPSGIVKGWAIFNAAQELSNLGYNNFYIEAGGDIEARGLNKLKKKWQIGIRNPFNLNEVIKIVELTNMAVATSGTYIRGTHIYNPHKNNHEVKEIKSISVIGPNIYEADRFATAAFVMGEKGINFIEKLAGFEGYMIDNNKKATLTSGFNTYVAKNT